MPHEGVMACAAADPGEDQHATSRRLAARREAFLSAAKEVFQEKGYAAATLDDVIAKSGGSRQTLYALFGGKQGLFEAIINDRCSTVFEALADEALTARPPEEVLEEVGIRFLTAVTSPKGLSLFRLVVAEGPRIPEISRQFWALGPGRTRDLLAGYFARQIERGVLRMPDARAAAGYFVDMLPGSVRLECLLGQREPPTAEEIGRIVRGAVAQFLRGCLAEAGAAGTADGR